MEIASHFDSCRDWYRAGNARNCTFRYYQALRSVLRDHADLRPLVKYCQDCGIIFVTYPCNANREDLRCPFGCRELHRKKASALRSKAYYNTEEGRIKKENLNHQRYLTSSSGKGNEDRASEREVEAGDNDTDPIIDHIRMITSLIEGRDVSREEVKRLLAQKKGRQHRLDNEENLGYLNRGGASKPP